jgi:protein-S-isoprenylcysteine O-methyltransferase Ste14
MSANTPQSTTRGIAQGLVVVAVFAVVLLGAAGRWGWPSGWAYVGLVGLNTVVMALLMDPELLAERSGVGEGARSLDVFLAVVMARLGPIASLLVIGLDERFGWSPPLSPVLQGLGAVLVIAGLGFSDYAVLANRYFSGVVRIQEERGHTVVSHGPYALVRHPGYAGTLLWYLGTPLMLASLWGLVPAVLTTAAVVARTAMEDRILQAELEGYSAYASRVRYRLLPGIW